MRAIIVGGGIMGLCTAWALCRSGQEVVLYEQGAIPNPLASSCDEHRLTRFTYGAMTGYARMVHEAHAAWDRLWADLGQSHFHPTGTLVVARDEGGWVRASQQCLEAMALPVDTWAPGELAARLPFLRFEGARFALYTPTGGVLFAERILVGLRRWLTEQGARLRPGLPVTDVDTERLAVRTADGRTDRADALLVAAGPWTPRLLPALRGRITPRVRSRCISSRRRTCWRPGGQRPPFSISSRRRAAGSTPSRRWTAPASRSAITFSRCAASPMRSASRPRPTAPRR